MHREEGQWQMIFGVATLPEYQKMGCASKLMERVIADVKRGRKGIVLTCKESLIPFYERFGFVNEGKSMSKHGEPCGMICGWYLKNCRKRNYYNMKKHRLPYMVAGAVLFAALFTGCTNERLEDELDFRKIGINSMQSGDYEGAVVAFNSALSQCVGKITDTELDICYYKAAAQYAGGDIEGALATYQAMIDYDEENGNAYYLHGCLSLKQQDTDTAKKILPMLSNISRMIMNCMLGFMRTLPVII